MVDIPKTCKAAVLVAYGKPLEIRDVKVPEKLEHGAILVKTDASSICGSDVHLWEGSMQGRFPIHLPVILGHEMTGTIVKLGPGVTHDSAGQPISVGDRLVWSMSFCGRCPACLRKQPTYCLNRILYMHENCNEYPYLTGGFSEYIYVFPGSGRVKLPDGVKSEWATSLSCALRAVVHTFELAGPLKNRDTVVIQGTGPLGLYATAMASRTGVYRVIVIGAPEQRLEVARKWGADETISIEEVPDPAQRLKRVMELTGGLGAEIVIEVSGVLAAFNEGLEMVRKGGRYIVTGQTAKGTVPMRTQDITQRGLQIIGTSGADISHYYDAVQFVNNNRDRYDWDLMISNRYYLNQVNEAIAAMQAFREIKPIIMPGIGP